MWFIEAGVVASVIVAILFNFIVTSSLSFVPFISKSFKSFTVVSLLSFITIDRSLSFEVIVVESVSVFKFLDS